ncbi:MAG TPA: glutamyl-tRNA reductase [Desulfobacteraceae bacterium]|nr:glutamyl-tRNA reductase [Desulfobacteraceae bacterium]
MIDIAILGMNHNTAPVEIRECIAKDPNHQKKALSLIKKNEDIKECLFISTCNRIEALYTTEDKTRAQEYVISAISDMGNIRRDLILRHLYYKEGRDAIRHIFRVSSSLDSMVMGEPQILGQVKEAYRLSTRERTSGVIINRLMHRAFHVAKRIRTETGICDSAVSVSYAAVELAKKIFHNLDDKEILLIGAGEMAELAAKNLLNHGVRSISVANRTFERATEVARYFNGNPISFEEIPLYLNKMDIVISSTASTEIIINYEDVKGSLRKRKNRPLFFIDIAVPRDIDPEINRLDNVYLYDIDDLKEVVKKNMERRKDEAIKAGRIVDEEVIKFERWLKTLDVVPTIKSLKEKAETIRQNEFKRSFSHFKGLSKEQIDAIERLTISITEKIITDPILFLKNKAGRNREDLYLDITKRLFRLDQEE